MATETGFNRPLLTQLISSLQSDLQQKFKDDDVLRRQDEIVYSRCVAAGIHSLYGHLDYLARNMLPDLADEEWLYRHSLMKRVVRKPPREAVGFARWEGVDNGLTVPAGVIIQRGDQVDFVTTAPATSVANVLRVPVRSVETGFGNNTDDGVAMSLANPINGLPSVAQADQIFNGEDTENIEEWRNRIIERWYWIPQGGADSDYEIWAKEVNGIARAWVKRTWDGPGTVGVMVATNDPDHIAPPAEKVQEVWDHIQPLAPVAGAGLFVFAVDEHPIPLTIRLSPDNETIRAAVAAEVKAMLYRDGVPGGKIFPSRISEAISLAADEFSHELIAPAQPVILGDTELPVLGAITWQSATN